MVRNEALFHMSMLLARYSNRAANEFVSRFEHQARVRSSDRAEMQEINEFWGKELSKINPRAARAANTLPVDAGIDFWISQFSIYVLHTVLERWVTENEI